MDSRQGRLLVYRIEMNARLLFVLLAVLVIAECSTAFGRKLDPVPDSAATQNHIVIICRR